MGCNWIIRWTFQAIQVRVGDIRTLKKKCMINIPVKYDDDDDDDEEEEEEEEEITFMFVNIHNDWRIFFLLTV